MFERSLLERTPTHRGTTIVSLTVQSLFVGGILTIPLLYPALLVLHTDAPKLLVPLKPAPPRPPRVTATMAAASSPAPTAAAAALAGRALILTRPSPTTPDAEPSLDLIGKMGTSGFDVPGEITGHGDFSGPRVALIDTRSATLPRISTGVAAGLLLAPIRPIYPQIAIVSRTEGAVMVEAIISKSGAIGSVHAISGPEMLRGAAVDAIRNARYSPYLLNGIPTEVQTTITVNFRLGG